MEWNEKLQRIVDYIESHLQKTEEPIVIEEIAKIADCSFHFFQKVFSYVQGISFAEYIRLRKLTLAGYDLKSTNMKVIEISYKYGYNSPTSFTKAFQQFHGFTPSEARNQNAALKICPKMQISTNQKYSWRLQSRDSFRLIGKKILLSFKNDAHYMQIPEFWSKCQQDGSFSRMVQMDSGNPQGLFGLFGAFDDSTKELEYSIMVISENPLPEGFHELTIPPATWAVFDCRGPVPQAIQAGWNYLHEEWLVRYPFQLDNCPQLEWYSSGNAYAPDYLTQIWLPVIEEN